jgi:predicted nucleic acid-binding protein
LELGNIINVNGGSMVYQGRSPKTIAAMLIAIIMTKEGLKDECKELLKDLKITNMILRKILQEVIQTIEKNSSRKTEDVERLKGLLSLL